MILSDLIKRLDSLIPSELSEEWDNDGVMLALDKEREVKKILVVLDVVPNSIDEAIKIGADVIISHHPFIFKPLSNLDTNLKTSMILKLIENNISVLSYHTRFDNVSGGMNDALAEALGFENIEPLEVMGRMGDLKYELTPEEFATYVSEKLSCDVILYSAGNSISKAAVLGGGGKDFVRPARLAGADAIVTGDVSHGVVTDEMYSGITIVDAGHFGTEKIFINAFIPFLEKAGVCADIVSRYEAEAPGIFICKEN